MSVARDELLLEMGLGPLWKKRATPTPARATALPRAADPAPAEPRALPAATAGERVPVLRTADEAAPLQHANGAEWEVLRREVADCRACALCEKRQQAVLGVGDPAADWLFIGEGPGADEDARGEPFVGAAGKLLDAMLAAIDLRRGDDVYIANAVKCRPPNNRTPEPAEIAACRAYLERQVALLRPKLVVLLGRAAVQATLGLDVSLASLRGKPQTWEIAGQRIPLVVTYHPAYLLRSPLDKARAWEDLCRARALMRAAKLASTG